MKNTKNHLRVNYDALPKPDGAKEKTVRAFINMFTRKQVAKPETNKDRFAERIGLSVEELEFRWRRLATYSKRVLTLLYGLDEQPPKSHEEVAKIMHWTPNEVYEFEKGCWKLLKTDQALYEHLGGGTR